MAKRRQVTKIDIDVLPYLSIMVITLNLICLILIVTVTRIALNPNALPVMVLEGLYKSEKEVDTSQGVIKVPSYVDCRPDGLVLYPGEKKVSAAQLGEPGNVFERLLDRVAANSAKEYVILLVRPNSARFYREARRMISERDIDVGYDAIDADYSVNWEEQKKMLGIDEQEKAQAEEKATDEKNAADAANGTTPAPAAEK